MLRLPRLRRFRRTIAGRMLNRSGLASCRPSLGVLDPWSSLVVTSCSEQNVASEWTVRIPVKVGGVRGIDTAVSARPQAEAHERVPRGAVLSSTLLERRTHIVGQGGALRCVTTPSRTRGLCRCCIDIGIGIIIRVHDHCAELSESVSEKVCTRTSRSPCCVFVLHAPCCGRTCCTGAGGCCGPPYPPRPGCPP